MARARRTLPKLGPEAAIETDKTTVMVAAAVARGNVYEAVVADRKAITSLEDRK